ncbi:cell division isoform B [Chlorella sorokiniana]|uniref:Cell division isoform B n=1 Tax=Chlorella sorokiniana TaxID=3076 RepID=A0A2P6U1U4_CHLSO|nr:cell division isoform B [Chlorella sorokiniana]|eukprot:PRW60288.1 cell division isoform B [Chlorella sorokiniana]
MLRAVRMGEVSEVHFFTLEEDASQMEGPCLVVMTDGTVAQGHIPDHDWRMHYALETHGVRAVRMAPTPTAAQLKPPQPLLSSSAGAFVIKWSPYALVGLVYLATSYVRWKKGDAEDRAKLRKKAEEDARKKAAEERQDMVLEEAEALARMGMDTAGILAKLRGTGLEVDQSAVEDIVARVAREVAAAAAGQAPAEGERGGIYNTKDEEQMAALQEWRREMEKQMAEGDPQAQAEQMLKMSTAKIRKARDPEKARKQKEAQKKLKNIKLMVTDKDEDVFFDDVAGIGDAKVELMEVVDFFRKPELFRASGSRIPRGVLLCGPPGTGKTLLARAVAGEAGATFIALNASEFVEMFVGVGASRVRDLFAQARAAAPAIIFIDEIDSVGRIRGGAKGNDERDQTLNQMLSEMDGFDNEAQVSQMLSEMDGFDNEAQVIVMGATNRRDILDPALVRPGRFDRIVHVPLPDYNGRIEILNVHLRDRSHSADIDMHELSFATNGYSGAQLANLVNMAATVASQRESEQICQQDIEKALEFERLGPERPPFSEAARRRIAAMEAATALTCTLLPAIEPVALVTIVPREKHPLGQTVVKANEARELTGLWTRRYLEQQLLTTLAGRAAEELIYGLDDMSTMHQMRITDARRIVQKLVVSAAMNENPAIGPRTISVPRRVGSLLMQAVPRYLPTELHTVADQEMERLIEEAYDEVKAMLQRNRTALDILIEGLVEKSTLDGDEVRRVVEQHASAEDLQQRAEAAAAAPFL